MVPSLSKWSSRLRKVERLAQLQALTASHRLEDVLPMLLANSETGLDPQTLERQFNQLRANWSLPLTCC